MFNSVKAILHVRFENPTLKENATALFRPVDFVHFLQGYSRPIGSPRRRPLSHWPSRWRSMPNHPVPSSVTEKSISYLISAGGRLNTMRRRFDSLDLSQVPNRNLANARESEPFIVVPSNVVNFPACARMGRAQRPIALVFLFRDDAPDRRVLTS